MGDREDIPMRREDGVGLVTVVLGFVRTVDGNADIIRLLIAQLSQFGSEFVEMQTRDFLIEFLAQSIDAYFTLGVLTNVYLSNGLIRKAVGHDEARVPGSATKVD